MSTKLLQVENLSLGTPRGSIVQNLSFDISPGEIVALTGKSGSGKTSIAMALLDLLPSGIQVKEGSIFWFGKDQQRLALPEDGAVWPRLRGRHIGYTQQDIFATFDPVLQMVKQMIMIVNERRDQLDINIESELRLKMEEVGLHDIDRILLSYPYQLSGGQLQRCQLAMSIVIMPELLISDEPTSAIDKINQRELLEVFSMLRSKYNMAILCITHEESVVRYLADREVQLDDSNSDYSLDNTNRTDAIPNGHKPVLEAKGLVYAHLYGGMTYKRGAIVGKLDFVLEQGTCLGVVGESGSGKSTLAQLLVGLYLPTEGSITLEGKQIDFLKTADVHHLRSKVQLVMQDGRGSLHPHFTIREILEEVVDARNSKQDGLGLNEIMSQVELPVSVLDRKPGQLSGGECLRVSLARAMLVQPEILICDESTSALDRQTRDGIIDLLKRLMKERGLSMIFISHDERIIRDMSHQIMVMADGKVVEKGAAAEVISYPTHSVTKKIFSGHATSAKSRRL
jgi:ABC-type glutathione transport system ATPase component